MQVDGDLNNKREEGEAPLVGTPPSILPFPVPLKLIEVIKSLNRVPEDQEIRPIEQVLNRKWKFGSPTPEEITLLVLSFEESMERLAA